MFTSIRAGLYRRSVRAYAAVLFSTSVWCGTATAQTTVVLNQADSQVADTVVRSGAFANTNYGGDILLTRRSTDPDWERRTLLSFDTQSVARGTSVVSATLTLTVKSGLGTTMRQLKAYRVTEPFQEAQATWVQRQAATNWLTAGGTIAEESGTAQVSSTPGSQVAIDLTALVQRTVNGDFDSALARVLVADAGADSKDSYREYYPSEDPSAAKRPTLTIVLAGDPTPPPTTNTIKVLQWNIAQGYGTDGKSNIDRIVAFIVEQRPDVISFNEIMIRSATSNDPKKIADKLIAQTGDAWTYHWVQKSGAATGEGECVMTRLLIEDRDQYLLTVARSVAMVRVTVNGQTINFFSTHLDHQSSATRVAQVKQLVSWAGTQMEQRIIAGDFNGWPGTNEQKEMLKTHLDSWVVAKAAGTALSFPGNPDGNTRNTRIDYVFASKGATAISVTGVQVFDTRDAAGVRPSDHNPLIVSFIVR
jgi:endonuclease/exonuclease/phosphatase family metal-dependent hydrolase